MGSKQLLLGLVLVVIVLLLPAIPGFSQVQAVQSRLPQQVLINGQKVNAVNVLAAGGGFQAFTCLNPQQYATLDGTSQGWACYEQATGVWLLNALPPAQAQQPQPPQQPPQPPVLAPQPQTQPPPPPVQVPQPQVQPPPVVYPQQPPAVVYPQQPPAVVYPQQPPAVVYPQQPPTVVYSQPPPTVVYAPPPPTVIYQQPPATIIYAGGPVYPATPAYPVVLAPAYPASVVLGTAAINAAGRIISSAIGYRYPGAYYYGPSYRHPVRGWRR